MPIELLTTSLVVTLQTEIKRHRERVVRIEARVHRLQLLKCAYNQASRDQHDQRYRDLCHDEQLAETGKKDTTVTPCLESASPPGLQREKHVHARCVKRRRQAEENSGSDRHDERERQYLPVQISPQDERIVTIGQQCRQHRHTPE